MVSYGIKIERHADGSRTYTAPTGAAKTLSAARLAALRVGLVAEVAEAERQLAAVDKETSDVGKEDSVAVTP